MKSAKLKQYVFSLLAILSLFASSTAACVCSHHQEKAEAPPSCHEHSASKNAGQNHEKNRIETFVSEAECVCVQFVSKIFAKSETVKFEKQIAAVSETSPIEIKLASQRVSTKIDFAKPFYLTDSFYNLSPGRAPPVL